MTTSRKYSTRILLVCSAALLLLPAAFAGVAAQFKILDTDNDGRLSRAEYAAGAALMFDRLDGNSDGVLTAEEMEACNQAKNLRDKKDEKDKKDENSADEKLAMSDANADGQLTRAENGAAADMMFTQLDTDNDGYLSKEECEACHSTQKKDK